MPPPQRKHQSLVDNQWQSMSAHAGVAKLQLHHPKDIHAINEGVGVMMNDSCKNHILTFKSYVEHYIGLTNNSRY